MKQVLTGAILALCFSLAHATCGTDKANPSHGCDGIPTPASTNLTNRSANKNVNKNTNSQSQNSVQGQSQAQTQNQIATGGAGGSAISGSSSATSTSNGGSGGNSAGGSVSITNPRSVASATAPALYPSAVCMGTSSGGAQGASFGFSVGSSWLDKNCMLLEQVRMVAWLGADDVAAEMLCSVDSYREARLRLGKPCIQASKAAATTKPDEYTDPIIRARLGLPPL